jgi:putative peptidoglycan lipid II flippase
MWMSEGERSTARRMGMAALLLAVSGLLSRILGFLRDVVLTSAHGAGPETDAYYAAFTLPDLMNYFLAGGTLSITFIPLWASYAARGDEEGGWRLFSAVATTMGLALVVFTLAGEAAAPWAVAQLNPGFTDPAQLALASSMTRIVLPAQLAFYIGGLLQATLMVREVFWTAAVAPLLYNLGIIAGGVLLAPWLGVEGFAVGVLVGAVVGPLGMPLWAARKEIRYRPLLGWQLEGFGEFFKLTLPLMLGATLVTVDEWLLRYFGSLHEAGTITWLNHSRKLMMVLFGMIGQAAGQAALPYLTRLWHEGKGQEMGELLTVSLSRAVFLSMVGAGGLAAVAGPLVQVVFVRGEFTAADAAQTSWLLVVFCAGMAMWSAQTIAVRGFYARRDTWTPMVAGTLVLLATLPVYWGLNKGWGASGLAASSSVGMALHVLVTIALYRRSGGELGVRRVVGSWLRGGALGGAMIAAGWGAGWGLAQASWMPAGQWGALASLVGQGGAGVCALLAGWALWRPSELEFVAQRVLSRIGRGRKRA